MRSWSDYKQTANHEDEVFEAARAGKIESLIFYIHNNGDVNIINHKGHSLLMLAAYNGHSMLTDLLLKHGADVNSQDFSGNTILMGVAFKGHLDIAKQLIEAGAHIESKNPSGQDALMFAEAFGRHEMGRLLRAYRNDETMVTSRMNTALRQASAVYRILQTSLFKTKGA